MKQKYRIYVKPFRPNQTENAFFGMLDEKLMLDYEVYYFFVTNDFPEIISLDEARQKYKYRKDAVYRSGNITQFINVGEQPLPL